MRPTRRDVLKTGAATAVAAGLASCASSSAGGRGTGANRSSEEREAESVSQGGAGDLRVVVVGAGVFGGWAALHLARAGADVTLIDAWEPGHSRASSGGETRVLRHGYGPHRIYVDMVRNSRRQWIEWGERWGQRLYHETGLLWMVQDDDAYELAALEALAEANLEHERFSVDELARRYPQIHTAGVRWAFTEAQAGFLLARRSCVAVRDAVVAAGGRWRRGLVEPPVTDDGPVRALRTSAGDRIEADAFVFACGPWLAPLFPDVHESLVLPTRQEVFVFGEPAGVTGTAHGRMPVWADHGERFWYGIPGADGRGFKLADDSRGEPFDPTDGDRTPSADGLARARAYLAHRFPALADAPLLESRVCQYENAPDGHFVIDRHPRASNVWLLGGGSGHGFKHGPAVGEMLAGMVLGEREIEPFFALSRFA